jgi:hypothetical protein
MTRITLFKLGIVAVFILMFTKMSIAQYASIQNTNLQIFGVLDSQKVASATNNYLVRLNKETGEFKISIAVDDLISTARPASYKPDTTLNEGKYLVFRGQIPIKDVLDKRISSFDIQVPIEIEFNDIYDETYFVFNVFLMANKGFNVIGKGAIGHQKLQIENLEDFEPELHINLNFVGY